MNLIPYETGFGFRSTKFDFRSTKFDSRSTKFDSRMDSSFNLAHEDKTSTMKDFNNQDDLMKHI